MLFEGRRQIIRIGKNIVCSANPHLIITLPTYAPPFSRDAAVDPQF